MRFIYLSLGIMFLLFVFGQAWQMREITIPEGYTQNIANFSGTFIVNGTSTSLVYGSTDILWGISSTQGILASIIGIVAFGTAIGIKVVDSGISEFSQKLWFLSTIYMGLWGIFMVFNYDLIFGIPVFGFFIFLLITVIHLFGIIQETNIGSGGN